MIQLTKRNGERFLVNHTQIESIEMIPESKIVMMNRDYGACLTGVKPEAEGPVFP